MNINQLPTRLAILCLQPDPGHLIPLLKIATDAAKHVHKIDLVVPAELKDIAETFGFSCNSFGEIVPPYGRKHLRKYVRSLGAARIILHNRRVRHFYSAPISHNLRQEFAEIKSLLKAISPDVILADESLFGHICERLAREIEVPIILNCISANLRKNDNTFKFGSVYDSATDIRLLWNDFRTKLAGEMELMARTIANARTDERRSIGEALAQPVIATRRIGPVVRISSGTSFLEKSYLSDQIDIDHDRISFPLLPPLPRPIDEDVNAWLNSRSADVVYISFGTVAVPSSGLVRTIVGQLIDRGKRVLLHTAAIELAPQPDDLLRIVKWSDQPAILSHKAVKLFVSHGGAGGVEEAIWAGTPLLCIPHAFDHYFCSWVARQLGVGEVIQGYQRHFPGLVSRRVKRVLSDLPELSARAQKLQNEVQSHTRSWDSSYLWTQITQQMRHPRGGADA